MQRPRMTWLVRLLAVAAFGAALALTAQAQTGQAADQNTDASAQGQQADAAQQDDAAADVEAAEEPADPNAVAQDGQVPTGTSPGRFIPREQLSQDLGASFPVDI
ncbi:MAG: hypothetical protein V4751_02985 [Pseudomonadota bacterium]